MTGWHRQETLGQKVCILNPWGLRGLTDAVRDLALQLVPEPETDAKNRFFREGSRKLLRALMLHLAAREDSARNTLPELWRRAE